MQYATSRCRPGLSRESSRRCRDGGTFLRDRHYSSADRSPFTEQQFVEFERSQSFLTFSTIRFVRPVHSRHYSASPRIWFSDPALRSSAPCKSYPASTYLSVRNRQPSHADGTHAAQLGEHAAKSYGGADLMGTVGMNRMERDQDIVSELSFPVVDSQCARAALGVFTRAHRS